VGPVLSDAGTSYACGQQVTFDLKRDAREKSCRRLRYLWLQSGPASSGRAREFEMMMLKPAASEYC
jgi:hypothetical protein